MSLNLYDVVFARGLGGGNGGSGGGSYKGMTIHVCTSSEYDSETNIPTISEPDDYTIYLVPGDGDENNIFNEYIYVDGTWELFGSATVNLSLDSTPTANSTKPVTSGGIKTALNAKQDKLTFDTAPTASSTNPVTSGGIKTALDSIQLQVTSAIKSPLKAATAAAMTDTTKVYIYTGSETGYTFGNWYYYDGSDWVSGGIYNATAFETDKTLTIENMAADSKAVGDLKEALNSVTDSSASIFDNFCPPDEEAGGYDYSTGAKISGASVRTPNAIALPDGYSTLIFIAKQQLSGVLIICWYSGEDVSTYLSHNSLNALTLTSLSVPSGAKYVRMSMLNMNTFADVCLCVGNNRAFKPYTVLYTVKEEAIPSVAESALPDNVLAKVENGQTAFEKFENVLLTNNHLPPSQESGYYTGSVGETLTKASSTSHVRTTEPVPFDSFTGEYTLLLKNAISGGGFCQIFFLADDKKTIVFTQSVNSANATKLHDFVPSTAKYFAVWVSKGDSNFSLSDISVTTANSSVFSVYQLGENTFDYAFHSEISNLLNNSKKIVVFGDSIFGMVDDETSVASIAGKYTNAEIINCAFGGTRLSIRPETNGYEQFDFGNLVNCVVSGDYSPLVTTGLPSYYPGRKNRLSHIDFNKVDTVILYYGTNDYMSGVTQEQVMSCANYIKTLQSAFPQIKVVYCSPAYRVFFDNQGVYETDSNSYNPARGTLRDYCAWYKAMAESINIEFVDCYNIGINAANYSRYFTSPDGAHHNANGRKLLGEYIGRRMLTV